MRSLKCISAVMNSHLLRACWRSLSCLRRAGRFSALACFFLFGFFAQVASAQEYSWVVSSQGVFRGASPAAACDGYFDFQVTYSKDYTVQNRRVERISNVQFRCVADAQHKHSPAFISRNFVALANRSGDSCEGTYNADTGVCVPPPEPEPEKCEPLTGQTTSASSVYPDLKYEFCINKCSAAVTSVDATSTPKAFGPTYIFYKAMFTGESCAEDTPQPDGAPAPPEPTESEEDKDCGPVQRVQDAEGRMHEVSKCVTEQSTRENQECTSKGGSMGEVQGVAKCIESKKGPTTKETKKEEKKETTTEPDGAKKESNTTTTETTVCKGGTCTTTKTTTNNSTKTNADGSSGGGSSSCKGDKCSEGGKEGGSGGGGGGGSGSDDSEEEKPESTVGGEACSAEIQCSGDAIQCAILRQQKKQQCADEKYREIDEPKLQAELDQHFAQEKFQPLEATGDNVFAMDSMFDTSRSISGSCPAVQDPKFDYGPVSIQIPLNSIFAMICPYFSWMGYLMIAFSMWRATEIVARGM